ncbi:hypothetical protein BH721_02785 [Clostridium baratii]|uniref:Uncharacterized protein n=1 Tax=Clostridium baratii TaxID=1561 RepID=A0A174RHE6_9CLOT|nr:hypothetical protein [Clostridium baratii]OPF51273.1 hypothetical protein A1M12_01690 [Clostridium baratii]OPF55651.1 hypothetical protein BH721_02785 [Clostridium baratii]OPF56969.1 hypothetical protein BH724_10640 [Clostridium baratii]OPF59968.1 hypothetical protein BH725_05140 [Clostridium baratii]CUP83611.1 Uncharacterised protein [Clostridium baratii]
MSANKKSVLIILVIIFLGIGVVAFKSYMKTGNLEKKNEKKDSITIKANYKEGRLYPMINIIEDTKSITLQIDGVEKESDLKIINPESNETIDVNDRKITLNNIILKDINYGILLNNDLVGIIRAVENKEDIDEEALSEEIYEGLKCAL